MSGSKPHAGSGPDFWAWYDAREPALQRLAFLLTLDPARGHRLLARLLPAIAVDWPRVGVERADERVLAELFSRLRREWASGPGPAEPVGLAGPAEPVELAGPAEPVRLPAPGRRAPLWWADVVWELLVDLPGPDRAAVVLSRYEGLDPDEIGPLTGAGAEAAQTALAETMDMVADVVAEAARRRPARLLPSPDQLLSDVLVERADAVTYVPVRRQEIEAGADALRRRRRLAVGGAVTGLLVVVGGLAAVLDPVEPAPLAKIAFDGRPVRIPQLSLARYDATGAPGLPYLFGAELYDPVIGRTTLPVEHPAVAVRQGRHVFVTDLLAAGDEQLVRVAWTGAEVDRAPTVGNPVVSGARTELAWLRRRADGRIEVRLGDLRQLVDASASLAGLAGRHVVLNADDGVWVTDLRSPPRRLTGVREATSVFRGGLVSAVADDGSGAVVDLEGRARWTSPDWLPGPISPDGRHVVAAGATRARLVHAFLDARTGRLVREVDWGDSVPRVIDERWEDARHLLLVAADLGRTAILRVDLDGQVTRATRPARVDVAGFSLYRFADG